MRAIRLSANTVLIAAVSCLWLLIHPAPTAAATYSCGTPDASHCYGLAQWDDAREIFAVSTTVSPVIFDCNSCDGMVDDEMWLADFETLKCQMSKFGACWIEVGFDRDYGRKNTDFFWADSRPGHGFSEHWFGKINGITEDLQFLIVKDTEQSATSTTYLVQIVNANLNSFVLHSGKSTKNTMTAKSQVIGQELSGSHGSAAAPDLFLHTQVSNSADQFVNAAALRERSTDGGTSQDKPPVGAWWVTPTNLAGGAFLTACCEGPSPTPLLKKIPRRWVAGLKEIMALDPEARPATGIAGLTLPPNGDRKSISPMLVQRYLDSQGALGRVSLHSSKVERLEFLTAREASKKLDSLDVGLAGNEPVILAALSGQFGVSAPKGGKSAKFSKAYAVFDARSGNLLTIYMPDS